MVKAQECRSLKAADLALDSFEASFAFFRNKNYAKQKNL